MLRAGDLIADRYRLIAPLAEGGMGAVWRAEHVELRVEIALKVLLDRVATPEGERRFRREAQAAAKLSSPHVVRVHDLGVFEGQPYLAMELLHGEDLEQRIVQKGPLSLERCAAVLDSIAKAVQLAHDHEIIHRDLKPANVFLATTPDGEVVKVLDFGIAKVKTADGHTTGQGPLGSPPYMSPEQVWNEAVEASTDVWSLGVIAFEMVAGRNPFEGGSLAKTFQRIVGEPLPRIGSFRAGLPMAVEAFFERALARSQADRFPSAVALAAAFRVAIGASDTPQSREVDGVSLPSNQTSRRVDPHARTLDAAPVQTESRRQPIAVAAALLVILAVGAAYFATRQSAAQRFTDAPSAGRAYAVAEMTAPAAAPTAEIFAVAAPASSSSFAPVDTSRAMVSNVQSAQRAVQQLTRRVKTPDARAPDTPPSSAPKQSAAAPSVDPKFGIPQ